MQRGNGAPRIPRDDGYGHCVLSGFVLVVIISWVAALLLFATTTDWLLPGQAHPNQAEEAHAKERDSTRLGDGIAGAATATTAATAATAAGVSAPLADSKTTVFTEFAEHTDMSAKLPHEFATCTRPLGSTEEVLAGDFGVVSCLDKEFER